MRQIYIFPVVLWLTFLTSLTLEKAVSVFCSSNFIDLFFMFDEPFVGKIVTRPNHKCSTIDAQTRNRCSIVEYESQYVSIIDVHMHQNLNLFEDTSYLVQCPKNNPTKYEYFPKPQLSGASTAKLIVFDKSKTTHTVKADKQYDLKLVTTNQEPASSPVEIKQCIMFTGNNELKLIQLTDNNGCSTTKNLEDSFEFGGKIDFKTRIKIIDPGNSSVVYLQCKLKKCDSLCQKVNCSLTKALSEATKIENTDYDGVLTSIRLDIQPTPSLPLCMIYGLSRPIIYCGVLFLGVMSIVIWTFTLQQIYKMLSDNFKFPSMYDLTENVYAARRFFKSQLKALKQKFVGLTSAVLFKIRRHHRKSSVTTFGENYVYIATRQVEADIKTKTVPAAPVRMSILNLVTHADQSLDEQQKDEGGLLSIAKTNGQEQLNMLEMFPEPPSISVHDVEQVFKNIIPEEDSADETELSMPSKGNLLQQKYSNQDDELKNDNSTLDRPITKKRAFYLKRVETLDVENFAKSLPQTSTNRSFKHTPIKFHMQLNVDESRLRKSLSLLKREPTISNNSIKRPGSTDKPYRFT